MPHAPVAFLPRMIANSAYNSKPSFDARLESLRGCAALAVVISHAAAALSVDGLAGFWMTPLSQLPPAAFSVTILTLIFNANAAVTFFFVLSGFVLTLSLDENLKCGWKTAYACRRFFRLIPPMWASIALMSTCLWLVRPSFVEKAYSLFFLSVFAGHFSASDIFANFILWRTRVNPVTWTMYVEVVGSAFIPVSIFLSRKCGHVVDWSILFIASVLALASQMPALTFHYLICFQCGVMLARSSRGHVLMLKSTSPRFLFGVAILLFIMPRMIVVTIPMPLTVIIDTAASALLLNSVIRGAFEQVLLRRPFRLLGKVSYSLYLFHLPVIYLTAMAFVALNLPSYSILPTLFMIAMALPFCFMIAWIGYVALERPSIALGRTFSLYIYHDYNVSDRRMR